jgi:hypothetical protein
VDKVHFYDADQDSRVSGGSINRRHFVAVIDTVNENHPLPHRDWGGGAGMFLLGSYESDLGLGIGIGRRYTRFGFRRRPFGSQFSIGATYLTGIGSGRLEVDWKKYRENSASYYRFRALASGAEVVRWHGFGNETTLNQPIAFYRATEHVGQASVAVGWSLSDRAMIEFGPQFTITNTEVEGDRFIARDRPFGIGRHTQLGVRASFVVDSYDPEMKPGIGGRLELGASGAPAILDLTSAVAEVHGEGATFLTLPVPTTPTFAVRVGGKKILGTRGEIPYQEAAFVGSRTLRGFRTQRFAGDNGAVWGSAELRLTLARATILVPGRQGIFAFYDRGRVFTKTEASSKWHEGAGGGIWFGLLKGDNIVSITYARSVEGNRYYFRTGFAF